MYLLFFLYNNTRSCDSKGRTDDIFLKCKEGFSYKYKYTIRCTRQKTIKLIDDFNNYFFRTLRLMTSIR